MRGFAWFWGKICVHSLETRHRWEEREEREREDEISRDVNIVNRDMNIRWPDLTLNLP